MYMNPQLSYTQGHKIKETYIVIVDRKGRGTFDPMGTLIRLIYG